MIWWLLIAGISVLTGIPVLMADTIQPFDWQRIFIGDQPWWFGLEIAGRTTIMYLYTLLVVRAMGTRTMGQLSLIEFLLVIGIGSAVGDPMVYHDVPLLHGIIVITVVVWLNRWVILMINNNEQFERLVEGGPKLLVSDGKMNREAIKKANLNREKLFELLRGHSIRHLGEVESAFLEQGGHLSLYTTSQSKSVSGLRVMPPWDIDSPRYWQPGDQVDAVTHVGCELCGQIVRPDNKPLTSCANCGAKSWVDAVVNVKNTRSEGIIDNE